MEQLDLPARPYLKPWQRLARDNGRMVFEYAHVAVVLEGKAVQSFLPLLLPLLDGTRTVDEIAEHVDPELRPAVPKILGMLDERSLLTDGPPMPEDAGRGPVETAQLLAAVSADQRGIAESGELLSSATVAVVGTGPAAREMARLLAGSGIDKLSLLDWPESAEGVGAPDLTVVAPEPEELQLLAGWNRLALDSGLPWMQLLPFDGRITVVGPIYVPGHTCCHECYSRRRGASLDYGDENFIALERSPAPYPSGPALRGMAVGLATTLIVQWLTDPASRMDSFITSHLPSVMHAIEWGPPPKVSSHRVYRVPRCPHCFESDVGTPSPWHD